ncbi:MAG: hypothetical protein FJY83_02045 [Candidatus Aminicenantes bacterium]|nr:hypothetical protein [Candidatus Aminicenantes bacterium]
MRNPDCARMSSLFSAAAKGAAALALAALMFTAAYSRQTTDTDKPPVGKLLEAFSFRALGPYRAGSWVTAFAVPSSPPRDRLYTFYVGTRNGGVWKTVNCGTTFEPVFDAQPKLSIGDVAVAPSDPAVVWVGTGEPYCARSSSSGDGVWKSADAGKTWAHRGLSDSHHIARVLIHPANPDIVYVVAMGRLFSTNEERGVYKTTDGGASWRRVLYLNDRIGAVDLALVESAPDTLYAAMYDKVRLPWHYELGGPESAVYKTTDGGANWTRLGGGLPEGRIGRIGLDVYQKDPRILYAVVENGNRRPPTEAEAAEDRRRGVAPAPRTAGNEVYRTDDGGLSWRKANAGHEAALNKAPYSFNQLRLDQNDPETVYITGQTLASTNDGGKTWKGLTWPSDGVMRRAFGDFRALWVDPLDSNRLLFGSDGGVNISFDRGLTCHHAYNIPLGEIYAVGVDMEEPYNIYCGLQDHDSWKGPSNGWTGAISLTDWVTVGEGDGMHNCVDPTDPRWLYNNREMGTMWRLDQKTGVRKVITPERAPGRPPLRFNWTPPIALSPHNPAIVYTGAQLVFRSLDRGDTWREISPDLTTDEDAKQHGEGYISYCTLTTLAESPVEPGVLWAGSDDGKVQVTRDGGATWSDRTAALEAAGGPAEFWTSRVFPSPHEAGTAFVSKTGWRLDDYRVSLHKTTDFGETWTSVAGDLPDGKPVNVVVQDGKNPNLLFAGTEWGLYATLDGGATWRPFGANLPSVKVTDLVIHPRENDLVVGTYGRGLYVADIAALQQVTAAVFEEDAYLFDIEPRVQRLYGGLGNHRLLGDSHLSTPNEPNAVVIQYYLKAVAAGGAKITVADARGTVLAEVAGGGAAGMNTAAWDMRVRRPGQKMERFEGRRAPMVEPGEYVVTLRAAGISMTKTARIRYRQGWTVGPVPVVIH